MQPHEPKRMERGQFRIEEFKNPSGEKVFRVYGWKVEGRGCRARVRENFKTHDEALARQRELEIQSANSESAARPVVTRLTPEQAAVAEAAFSELDGKPLLDAVRFYLENYREPNRKITVADAFKEFIEEREAANLRPLSILNLRAKTSELVNTYGQRTVGEIGADTLRQLIFKPERGPKTRGNYRRGLHAFFAWAEKQGYCRENPVAKITAIKAERQVPIILMPEEAGRLIEAARQHKRGLLVPYVALGLFAGLRPTELARLTWEDIDLADNTITIGAQIAKMRARRIVEVSKNLAQWLAPFAAKANPIVAENWRRDFDAVKAAAGWGGRTGEGEEAGMELKSWTQDIMRHTAISYHLAQYQHEGKTASWAGNSPDVVQKHYKGLVKAADAKKFWSIGPPSSKKIVKLSDAAKQENKIQRATVRAAAKA